MDGESRSREEISDRIESLERAYGSFPVNQRTITVPPEGYERAIERSKKGLTDVYVQARNDEGEVLLVRGNDSWRLPTARTKSDESLEEGAKRRVRAITGVECTIEGIHQATILGFADEDERTRDTVYRLAVVFVCQCSEPLTGQKERVAWEPQLPAQVRR